MLCRSASFSTSTESPRSGSTASASSHSDSQRASWKPASRKTPTASSSCGSLGPPTMTSVISQGFLEPLGEALRHPELDDLIDRRFADGLHRAEVSQERALARGPDALDRVERRGQSFPRPHLSVVRDRKTVGFVADPLDQEHPRRASLLHDRVGPSGRKDLLTFLGE